MSTFEITGTVASIKTLTSKQGKPYISFGVLDSDGNMFELSLFGQSMSLSNNLVMDKKVSIKGLLASREYNGKYYTDLRVQWVEVVTDKVAPAPRGDKMPVAQSSLDDLPF